MTAAPDAGHLPAVNCLIHGPMKWRPGVDWWECAGFDGEGRRDCGVMLVYIEDAERWREPGDILGVEVIRRERGTMTA
jgi:hypothetical protein